MEVVIHRTGGCSPFAVSVRGHMAAAMLTTNRWAAAGEEDGATGGEKGGTRWPTGTRGREKERRRQPMGTRRPAGRRMARGGQLGQGEGRRSGAGSRWGQGDRRGEGAARGRRRAAHDSAAAAWGVACLHRRPPRFRFRSTLLRSHAASAGRILPSALSAAERSSAATSSRPPLYRLPPRRNLFDGEPDEANGREAGEEIRPTTRNTTADAAAAEAENETAARWASREMRRERERRSPRSRDRDADGREDNELDDGEGEAAANRGALYRRPARHLPAPRLLLRARRRSRSLLISTADDLLSLLDNIDDDDNPFPAAADDANPGRARRRGRPSAGIPMPCESREREGGRKERNREREEGKERVDVET
uniref:Uncharacterized protein n=1 Tax=Oryza sativa subsp. japonica TaxID=39947 RepID=Q6K4A8_ORYSJ|nr:hypothetical protein [Oryza sativa Japonica Group]BAD22261.1 hypothetical protein [Oryza sativa Japonica Group]